MNRLITILCIIITLNVEASSPTLCQVNEQVIFACTTKDNKIISLCASRYLDANKGYLQYRFGTSNAIELQYPSVKLLPAQAFKGRNQQLGGRKGTYLRFQNNDYDYIVYNDASKGWTTNGVIILKNTEFKQYIACKNQPNTQLLPSLLTTLTIANDNDNGQFFISDIPATVVRPSTSINNSSTSKLTVIK
jgi:hypothetical protein